jgi:hypothetical protein
VGFLPFPSKPPTREEYTVLAVGASGLLIVLGVVGFGIGLFAPPQKAAAASLLFHYSAWSVGIGAFIGFGYWLFRRLSE